MKIGIQGIMPSNHGTIKEIVESIESPRFSQIKVAGLPPTTIAFECDAADEDAVTSLVKSTIRGTAWGKSHVFYTVVL